jgi:predicted DNA-binding transcriptional regulator AlpA
MDLKNLISRVEIAQSLGIQTQTIAKWEREGKFPAAKEYLSDRLILYDREEVRRTLDLRKAHRRRRMLPHGSGG